MRLSPDGGIGAGNGQVISLKIHNYLELQKRQDIRQRFEVFNLTIIFF